MIESSAQDLVDLDDLDLPDLSTEDPEYLADPHGTWRELRTRHWLVRSAFGVNVLPYAANHELSRSRHLAAMGDTLLAVQGITDGVLYTYWTQGLLLSMDGPQHDRLRALLHKAFTPRLVEELRPAMREVAQRLAGRLTEGAAGDFTTFASRYPAEIIARLLGIPIADIDVFEQWATDVGLAFSFPVAPVQARAEAAISSLFDYAGGLIARRRTAPADDLISALIAATAGSDDFGAHDLQWTLVNLTFGGMDTTCGQLALLMRTFGEHPEQWRRLSTEPSLASNAVEEGLRLHPAVPASARLVAEEFTHRGVRFPAGTLLALRADAANRDPEIFAEPDTFDITRANAARHLTLGGGVHHCLGAYLARAEMQEALPVLAASMPDMTLDGPGRWRPYSGAILGPEAMPIRCAGSL